MMTLDDYQALFRASPYLYLVMSPDLTIIGASGAYLRSVQRTEEEIIGRYVFDAFPENPADPSATDVSEIRSSLLRAMAKGEPDTTPFVRYAVPIETAEGRTFEERYWSTVHTPVLDADGKPILVFQNPVDVTELYRFDERARTATLQLTPPGATNAENFNRAQMHEALSRILNNEREHLGSLFNQSPGFVAVLMGPKFVFELVNDAYYQLVGHRELIGKPLWDALPEVRGQGFEGILNAVFTTGVPWSGTAAKFEVQREQNGPKVQRYVNLVYQPYKDPNGVTIGIFVQGYDVTDVIEAQTAREESDERLRDGMDATKMVVWDWDVSSGELAYSDNIERVLGCRPLNMKSIAQFIHEEDRERISAAHRDAIAEGAPYQEIVRFIRPDSGVQIWIDSRGRVQKGGGAEGIRIRGVTVDVTERVNAEIELREANKKKDEFLAMLAHELRNPLAPISTAAEMLRLTAAEDSRVKKASEVITRQVKHMTSLVDDLLDVSRVTRGLVRLENEYVDVKSAVSSAVEQARPLIEARRHNLTVKSDSAHASIKGDRTRLAQVIVNLLNNAAKYTPQGGEIDLSIRVVDAQVEISIKDNGIGMEDTLVPHVFELFTQAERTSDRVQGGLGIGLSLVHTLVSLQGGTVTATSEGPGHGSTFVVTLPVSAPPTLANHVSTSDSRIALVDSAVSIMIVDDNVDAGESLAALLEAHGHSVSIQTHPLCAITAARSSPPQVFILDIGLPEIDGYELVRRLRWEPVLRNSMYIALTGYGQAHDRTLSMTAGFDHHFVKPMDAEKMSMLLEIVNSSISKSRTL